MLILTRSKEAHGSYSSVHNLKWSFSSGVIFSQRSAASSRMASMSSDLGSPAEASSVFNAIIMLKNLDFCGKGRTILETYPHSDTRTLQKYSTEVERWIFAEPTFLFFLQPPGFPVTASWWILLWTNASISIPAATTSPETSIPNNELIVIELSDADAQKTKRVLKRTTRTWQKLKIDSNGLITLQNRFTT